MQFYKDQADCFNPRNIIYSHETEPVVIKATKDINELKTAFNIVYTQYVMRGYMQENSFKMRYSLLDLLPYTTTFVAYQNGRIIGTISAVLNSPSGLPSKSLFQKFYSENISAGLKIGEGTKLACLSGTSSKFSSNISQLLIKWLYFWSISWSLDRLYVVANPRHVFFWEKGLGFSKIFSRENYSLVEGHPAVLLGLDTSSGKIYHNKIADKIYSGKISPSNIKKSPEINEDGIQELLLTNPLLLLQSSKALLEQLQFYYPSVVSRTRKYLRKKNIYIINSKHINVNSQIDYVLDNYEHSADSGVYFSRLRPLAFRKELRKIVDSLEQQDSFLNKFLFCKVDDNIPDNLIFDLNLFTSIMNGFICYFNNMEDKNSININIRSKNILLDEVKLSIEVTLNTTAAKNISISSANKDYSLHLPESIRVLQQRLKTLNSTDLTILKYDTNIACSFSVDFLIHEGSILYYNNTKNMRHKEKSLKILVAEDNFVNQILVKKILEKSGHTVKMTGNGLECVEEIQKENYDCVIMDCQMPVMDGFDATRKIRLYDKKLNIHTPIIALTAFTLKYDMKRCLDAGMDAYLTKPIQVSSLLNTIQELTKESDKIVKDNLTIDDINNKNFA